MFSDTQQYSPFKRAYLDPYEHIGEADNNQHSNDDRPGLIILLTGEEVMDSEYGAHDGPEQLSDGEEDVDVEESSHLFEYKKCR